MNLRHLTIAAVAACGLAGAGIALAQPQGGWHHGGFGGGDMEFLRGLNLTDAQKEQARSIEKSAWEQAKPLMEQMHTLHEQVITTLLTAGSTQAQVAGIVAQEESIRNQLDTNRVATALQLRNLLTSDQLSQAADLHTRLAALHEQEHEAISAAKGAAQ
jgi:Spy/CpxP family protein refolding chaperone